MLHIFNPYHDLALANACPSFKAPESALHMAHDLSLVPCWYAEDGDVVVSDHNEAELGLKLYPNVSIVPRLSSIKGIKDGVLPWGWDHCVVKYLEKCGIDETLVPSNDIIDDIRELSHRKLTISALEFIKSRAGEDVVMPQLPLLLETPMSIEAFAAKHEEVVFKAPWSSSGKGIFWNKGKLTPSIKGWCQRILEKQGAVMGEIAYDKIQDFAMEFHANGDGSIEFAGYSLFYTERAGIYHGNRLMSNEDVELELSRWISIDYLCQIKNIWIDFLRENISGSYVGYLGVDMFVYKVGEKYALNPSVEVNLRMTMGVVARIFYDRYIKNGAKGWFNINHEAPGKLKADDIVNKDVHPLEFDEGKIVKGYCSLCPISEDTIYSATVIID